MRVNLVLATAAWIGRPNGIGNTLVARMSLKEIALSDYGKTDACTDSQSEKDSRKGGPIHGLVRILGVRHRGKHHFSLR